MPLHRWFVPPTLYSREDKAAIAAAVTKVYKGLPEFYVLVLFVPVEKDDFYVSGKADDRFVRIGIEHIARQFPDNDRKRAFMGLYEKAIEPWTKGRGIDWEIQITDDDPVLWNENGLSPPAANSDGEKLWREKNKAVPFEGPSMASLPAAGSHL